MDQRGLGARGLDDGRLVGGGHLPAIDVRTTLDPGSPSVDHGRGPHDAPDSTGHQTRNAMGMSVKTDVIVSAR